MTFRVFGIDGKGLPSNKDFETSNELERCLSKSGNVCECCGVSLDDSALMVQFGGQRHVVCQVCQALHNGGIDETGKQLGVMILLPSIPQHVVISMAWSMWFDSRSNSHSSLSFIKYDSEIGLLSDQCEKIYGSSNPDDFVTILKSLKPNAYLSRDKLLGSVKWFPDISSKHVAAIMNKKRASILNEDELTQIKSFL